MPTVTIDTMTEEEKAGLSQHLTEILLANADGYCTMNVRSRENGSWYIESTVSARGGRAENLNEALRAVQEALDEGKADITQVNGKPMLGPAVITRTHQYPMAHMSPEEEAEFDQAVRTVNHAIMARRCRFESHLDDWAQIYFRYQVMDEAPDPHGILQAIDLIIMQVHAGRAVRIEMPGGGVMLMPRWPAAAAA